MKRKYLLLVVMVIAIMSVFAITASAENKIIKLDTLPTLEQIHANPSAYVSHLDAFDESSYKEKDGNSVVVLSDLAETPTYYVYPSYYILERTSYYPSMTNLNNAVTSSGIDAFASFASTGQRGSNVSIIRIEIPTFITQIDGNAKLEGSKNVKEIYFPTKLVTDAETGLQKEVACVTNISGEDLFGSCSSLEIIHNVDKLPLGIIAKANFSGCSKLKEFKLPEGVTSLSDYLFSNCSSLTKIDIPDTVKSIGRFTFNNCSSITELILPNGLTSVGKHAFGGCSKLEKIVMGASFTTFSRYNQDYETFSDCSSLKYIYLPATFADSVNATANDFKTIFNHSAKTIYFVTEDDYDKIVSIQNKFITTNNNPNISGATIELYDENKDYETYQAQLTKSVIVYGYDYCKAFYKGVHNYQNETGNCLDGVTCKQCGDNISNFGDHDYEETIVYLNGFTSTGLHNKYCKNASNCEVGKIADTITSPIFQANEENGFSTNGTGIAFGGYVVGVSALNEYNRVNDADISFGILMVNPKYLGDSFFSAGEVNATKGALKADMSTTQYSNIQLMMDGFTGEAASLELVIALYAYTDVDDVEFIQSQDTKSANSKVTKSDATLYTVTVNSVMNKPCESLDNLGEYIVPTKED